MTHNPAALAYREASVQQASPVGLVIMLYDALSRDLRRAINAMHAGDIVGRCNHLKHGFLILQQLEGLLDMNRGGATATNLSRFYAHLRTQMLAAQFKLDANILERQIVLLLEVRAAWQQLDSPHPAQDQSREAASLRRANEEPAGTPARLNFSCSV